MTLPLSVNGVAVTFTDFCTANSFDSAEASAVAKSIAVRGYFTGGGGASPEFTIGTEAGLRVAAGRGLAALLAEWLEPEEFALCVARKADPPDFCDDNMATLEACASVWGVDDSAFLDDPRHLERMNAATRLSSRVIIGPVTDDEALAIVAADDSHGLSPTITRAAP